jgi:O-antigen/teichoic acid export membrane protein
MTPGERLRLLLRPSVTAFYDQFSISGINFVTVILIARSCAHLEFAAYGLALAIWAFSVSLQRSVVVLPLIVAHAAPEFREVPGKWVWVNIGAVGLLLAALCAALLVFSIAQPDGFAVRALTLTLMMTPTMLLYEFSRRLMYTLESNIDASVGATIVAISYAAGVLVSAFVTRTATAAALGLGIGGALAALYGALRHRRVIGRPDLEGFRQWRALAVNTAWHLGSFLAYSTYTTALPIIVATFGSPSAVAALVATRNLTNPGLTISTAVDSFEKPRAGRAFRTGGLAALYAATARTRRLLLAVNTPLMILLGLFAGEIVGWMRGGGHPDYVYLIYLWIGVVTATLINQPYETALIIQRKTAILFWSKLAGGIILLLGAALLVPRFGATGALYATLAATVVNLAINAARARESFRRHAGDPHPATAGVSHA